MKVLFVVHQFFPLHHTGTERLTLDLAKQLQRMGNYVSVLTYEPPIFFKNSKQNIENNNKKSKNDLVFLDEYIQAKKYMVETIPVISVKHKKSHIGTEIFDSKIEKHLIPIIKEFDIVHFTHPGRLASVLKCCKQLNIPTILTLTDTWLLCPINLLTRKKQLCSGPEQGKKCMEICNYGEEILTRYNDTKFFFDNIDRIFSGSNFIRSTFNHNNWNKKIFLNTFSVDYSNVNLLGDPNEIIFSFMGSFGWHKGLHVLLLAFKEIKNENVKLKIYGRGIENDPYVDYLYELAKGDNRIEFCGTYEYNDISKIMKEISLVIIPSTYQENFPLVMQIALAHGKPIIASKIGGMPEVIEDGKNGYLFEIGNKIELTKILQKILDNPVQIKNLQRNIIKPPRIEEESFTYHQAYKELVKNKK